MDVKHTTDPRPLIRDYELEAAPVGATTRFFEIETDPLGGIYYQFGRRVQTMQLPRGWAHARLGVIDMLRCAALVEPPGQRLVAFSTLLAPNCQLFLMGRSDWGRVFDENNQEFFCADIPALLRRWKMPILCSDNQDRITFDIPINILQKEVFSPATRECLRDKRNAHHLMISYAIPSGDYLGSRVDLREPETGRPVYFYDIEEFPLTWPASPAASPAPAAGRPRPGNGYLRPSVPPQAATAPPAGPGAPARTGTELTIDEVVRLIENETNPERRWALIEQNLRLAKPERTYQLLVRHAELIGERIRDWPPARLKTVLGFLPGSLLLPLMQDWCVNQVLALAEGNGELDHIMQWLREREVERLLNLKTDVELLTSEQARAVLSVDRFADTRAIRKCWRTLVGFLNADHGRSHERPIHLRKDEVVKHLQLARDLLLRMVTD